jgi:site-specific recombinase XerD
MNLLPLIDQFIKYRQAMGEQWSSNCTLRAFARSIGANADIADVTPAQINRFLVGTGPVTLTWHIKLGSLRSFYQYAISRGYVDRSPLPTIFPQRPPAFIPHVYTHEELTRLLQAAKSFERPSSLEPGALHLILLVIYATGLRIRELVRLDRADVNLPECLMKVRESKFGKTRLVPFAPQLQRVLLEYQSHHPASSDKIPFFAARCGGRIKPDTLQHNYRALCDRIGLCRTDGASHQPRIHDLRHSFAVHRLISWYRQGADVQRLLPLLSVYLGHVHIRATQVYLSMTPDLLEEASNRFEQYAARKEVRHG